MQMKKIFYLLSGLALAFFVAACSDQGGQTTGKADDAPAPQTKTADNAADAQHNHPQFPLTGKVVETFDSGGYTYARLQCGPDQFWVATAATDVNVGEDVTCAKGMVTHNFTSKTLNRTFDEIIFASGFEGKESKMPPAAATAAPSGEGNTASSFAAALQSEGDQTPASVGDPGVAMGSGKAVVPFADLKVEKADGDNAFTVAELYSKAADLDGKKVRVKGQVMKVSQNIMGKNWVHIQDGTGNPKDSTHDLVVTTAAVPEKGQIITVEGTLAANKDFGAGYKYNVIVEDADLK